MKRIMGALLALVLTLGLAGTGHAAVIDLNTWSQAGPPGVGDWTVSPDGTSVYQSINGDPTYFVSDIDYINTQFDGNFAVRTTSDDDFIGFVFGWNGPDDFYLFDWKQATQRSPSLGVAYEGFTLSKISGSDLSFWTHTGEDIEVLASSYGSSLGWVDYALNSFVLDYAAHSLTITINDQVIFYLAGSFEPGRFGFYNFSQAAVRYQSLGKEISPSAVPEPGTFALLAAGLLGLVGFVRRRTRR